MSIRRALFIRFGGLGDILLATPTLRTLVQAHPDMEVDFVVGGGMTEALSGNPMVRHILCFDKRGIDSRIDHFLPFLWKLHRQQYDLVVNLHPSAKSYLMAWASGAKTCLTFKKQMSVCPGTGQVAHAIDDFAKEVLPLGVNVTDRHLDFFVPESAHQHVEELLLEQGVSAQAKLLVINPAASRPLNRWPLERFCAVAACCAQMPDVRVIITGAPPSFRTVMDGLDEVALAKQVSAVDPRIVDMAGQLTVKEFGALLTRASLLLTCDTGPMHIAAALHTPMVVLSGAADPHRTGPLTDNSTVLIDSLLPCVPCRDRVCARGDMKCMDNLSVSAVIAAVQSRLIATSRKVNCIELPIAAA